MLIYVLSRDDPELYRNFVRRNEVLFNEIVERMQSCLEKQRTFWRKPLDVGLRLAVTLRFLVSGCSYKDMAFDSDSKYDILYTALVPHQSAQRIIHRR